MKGKNGFALAMALWISAILMASTLFLISMYKKSVDNAKALNDKLQTELIAESYIDKFNYYVLTGKVEKDYIENILEEFPKKLYFSNKSHKIKNNDANITITLRGGGNMLSIYTQDENSLNTLINFYMKKNINYADTFTDWIDTDTTLSLNGAEDGYYKVSTSYSCSNRGVMQNPEELFLMKYFNQIPPTEQKEILSNFQFSIRSGLNPYLIQPKSITKILHIDDFSLNQLKELYKSNYSDYITKVTQKMKEAVYIDTYGPTSIITGNITVTIKSSKTKRLFHILFQNINNKPYIIYKNVL